MSVSEGLLNFARVQHCAATRKEWGVPGYDDMDRSPRSVTKLKIQTAKDWEYSLLHTLWYMFMCISVYLSVEFSSVAHLCPTLCDPMDCSTPGLPVHHQLPEFTQTHVHWFGDAIHLILCRPLLLPPSVFPSIRIFSDESVHCIRWPKYWSFSFRISPSNEHSELISFRIDWLDLLAVQGTLKSLLQHHCSKASILCSLRQHIY